MIEFVKGAISGLLIWAGKRDMALYNETTFSTYLRPGEALRLKAADFIGRSHNPQGYRHAILVLAPFERGESSKAGIYDEVSILDDERASFLPQLLEDHVRERLRQDGETANMWTFSAKEFLTSWRKAVKALSVDDCAISPYQNRHGASRDHLLKLRTVASIQRRGRWAVDSSARIYDKPGRLQQMVSRHAKWADFGERVRLNFLAYYRSGTCPLPQVLRAKASQAFAGKTS